MATDLEDDRATARAENAKAVAYLQGQGVAMNPEQAAIHFKNAADLGYTRAQFNLGLMYAKGIGVPMHPEIARYWFSKAAQAGEAKALDALKAFGLSPAAPQSGEPKRQAGEAASVDEPRADAPATGSSKSNLVAFLAIVGLVVVIFLVMAVEHKRSSEGTALDAASRSGTSESSASSNYQSSASSNYQGGDIVAAYANNLASQLERASHPICGVIAHNIRSFGNSGQPDFVRSRQVESLIDKAPEYCFR